ncbi:MAG: hypothetical protein ACRD2R_06755 [Terriglobales bacterium]
MTFAACKRFLRALLLHWLAPPRGEENLRLEQAVLCLDCETVSTARNATCPACAGRALMSLSRPLGGPLEPGETARLVEDSDWWADFTRSAPPRAARKRETS